MASSVELLKRASARAEELLGRPSLDWTVQKNWAGDTVEILEIIYGTKHRKAELFRAAGEPGAVRLVHRAPSDPTFRVKKRIMAQVAVLHEFSRELHESEKAAAASLFSEPARARLWHVLSDLFPPPTHNSMGSPVTRYEQDLEEFLHRRLDAVQLAKGATAGQRLQTFVLHVADDSVLNRVIAALPDAYLTARRIEPRQREKMMAVCILVLNAYLESIGHELRFDPVNYRLLAPGLDTSAPKGFTALPNAEMLTTELLTELRRPGRPVALIAFDLDGFKAVNDRAGHPAGDACLQSVVDAAAGIIHRRGRLYRPGGDEFVILLPNTTLAEAAATAERVRSAIEKTDLRRIHGVSVTTSIGVACSDDESEVNHLLKAADDAAYASKLFGKNRVTTWPLDSSIAAELAEKRSKAEGR